MGQIFVVSGNKNLCEVGKLKRKIKSVHVLSESTSFTSVCKSQWVLFAAVGRCVCVGVQH